MRSYLSAAKGLRNCIGFGSGVLGSFGGFCFCFCNLIFGSGGGLVFGWAGLCWAGRFFFLLWNLILASWGRLAGFAFCFCRFGWAGLGWAAAGLGWAGLSSRTFQGKFETNENAIRSETHTISIYPALEGLGFRV